MYSTRPLLLEVDQSTVLCVEFIFHYVYLHVNTRTSSLLGPPGCIVSVVCLLVLTDDMSSPRNTTSRAHNCPFRKFTGSLETQPINRILGDPECPVEHPFLDPVSS